MITIFGENIGVFLKNQCYDIYLHKLCSVVLNRNCQFFLRILWRKYLKNHNIGPWLVIHFFKKRAQDDHRPGRGRVRPPGDPLQLLRVLLLQRRLEAGRAASVDSLVKGLGLGQVYILRSILGLPDGILCKPKIPIWVNFGGPQNGKCWYILRPFGTYYGPLIYFLVNW
jgi:hypothetical protein